MWRFDCSSSTVPVAPAGAGSAEPWSITAPTSLAFRTLAAQSCNILTGIQAIKKKDIFCQPFLLFFFFFFLLSFPSKCTKQCICFAASLYSMLLASSKMVICSPMETYRFLFFFVAKLAHNMSSFFIRRPASHWVDKEVAVIYVCFFGRGCYS